MSDTTVAMGTKRVRHLSIAAAVVVLASACSGAAAPTTSRPPITTTLPPEEMPTTTLQTTTTAPPVSSTTTTSVTTTTVAAPVAIGMPDDPNVAVVAAEATRYFYVGNDVESSSRDNVAGVPQALFYDVYPPTGSPNGTTAVYVHGGGFNLGYANDAGAVASCRLLAQFGSWCVSVEYRRGFAAFTALPDAVINVSAAEADRYAGAVAMARADVVEAWGHVDSIAATIGLPQRYIAVGDGSGASIVSSATLTGDGVPYDVAGALIAFGSPFAGESIDGTPAFPVVIKGGLLDTITPAYTNNIFFDGDMPVSIGIIDLYDELAATGAPVRLLLHAQQGHEAGTDQATQSADFATAVALFLAGRPSGAQAAMELRFVCNDAAFGAAGPGVRINSVQFPGFRYEPYQSDLEAGLNPDVSLELHPMVATNCEN